VISNPLPYPTGPFWNPCLSRPGSCRAEDGAYPESLVENPSQVIKRIFNDAKKVGSENEKLMLKKLEEVLSVRYDNWEIFTSIKYFYS
jgi:hypothetical protein